MQRIGNGDQRPVDAILSTGGVLQPLFAVIQFAYFRKWSANTGHVVGVIAAPFSFIILN